MPVIQKNVIFDFYFENRRNEVNSRRKDSKNDLTFKVILF